MGINRTRSFGRQKKDAWAASQCTLYGFRLRRFHFLSPLFLFFSLWSRTLHFKYAHRYFLDIWARRNIRIPALDFDWMIGTSKWLIDWLIDVFFIWKPNRLGVPSYRESHVNGKGVPKSRECNTGMPQRRRQRVPQKWASKERRDCTRAVTDVGQGKRDKRLTPCYRSCACIWLAKNRKLIC